jgi:hypothetical protein
MTTTSNFSSVAASAETTSATSPVLTSRSPSPCASAAMRALCVAGANDSTMVTRFFALARAIEMAPDPP